MNPATPGLSVLLVPPDGDTALLAPEWCGGRVPEMHRDVLAPPGWSPQPAPAWHIEGVSPTYERALVIAYEGKPVAMGIDRAKRALGPWWWKDTPRRLTCWLAGDFTATYLIDPQAKCRVVLLRDGREVES